MLIPIDITIQSNGSTGQGCAGADFAASTLHPDFGITVDTTSLKIHDILYQPAAGQAYQVDTETDANLLSGSGGYSKPNDTWVYDVFTDFTGSVTMGSGRFEANAGTQLSYGYDVGITAPVNFVHLVLEVQAGFTKGSRSSITFFGQVGAYPGNQTITSSIFGTSGGAVNTGSFSLTNLITGDASKDCKVNVIDLGILSNNYGQSGPNIGWANADFNGDHSVNVIDLGLLASNYGFGISAGTPDLPEPASLVMILLGMAVFAPRYRQNR